MSYKWTLILSAVLAGCNAEMGSPEAGDVSADDVGSIQSALTCGATVQSSPEQSLGRPKAILTGGTYLKALTNTGRRDLTEFEVNSGGLTYLSGCKGNFCNLYWVNNGAGAFANISRSRIKVWRDASNAYLPATDCDVRLLGGKPISGTGSERWLRANADLRDIWHNTNDGLRPLTGGYSCPDINSGACTIVGGADAPPNTPEGGKGYAAGIYMDGKTFYRLPRTVSVSVVRNYDKAPGTAEWAYGYVKTSQGRVYMWVITKATIGTQVYGGYMSSTKPSIAGTASVENDDWGAPVDERNPPAPTGFRAWASSYDWNCMDWTWASGVSWLILRDGVPYWGCSTGNCLTTNSFCDGGVGGGGWGQQTHTYQVEAVDSITGFFSAPTGGIQVQGPPGPNYGVPLHEWWSETKGDHVYHLNGSSSWDTYAYQGVAGKAFNGLWYHTNNVYKYYDTCGLDNFYTMNWNELGGGGGCWNYNGVGFYLFPGQWPGTSPFYRYYNPTNKDHYYSKSYNPSGLAYYGYYYEGVLGYSY
jgi:hypothetical protein